MASIREREYVNFCRTDEYSGLGMFDNDKSIQKRQGTDKTITCITSKLSSWHNMHFNVLHVCHVTWWNLLALSTVSTKLYIMQPAPPEEAKTKVENEDIYKQESVRKRRSI